eukprot:scaffold4.g4965.t1
MPARPGAAAAPVGRRPCAAAVRPRRGRPRLRAAAPAVAAAGLVSVRFTIERKVDYGESLKVVGSEPALGSWRVADAPAMAWGQGDVWSAEVELPAGAAAEFKIVRVGGRRPEEWEEGANHQLALPAAGDLAVAVDWSQGAQISSSGAGVGAAEAAEAAEALDGVCAAGAAEAAASAGEEAPGSGYATASDADDSVPRRQWQGRDVVFMQSNNHTRERQGVWRTEGLAPGSAALAIVEGDRGAANWLGKLEALTRLLVDDAPQMRPDFDTLANAYIYIQERRCRGVPRELSKLMFRSLEWVIDDATRASAPATALAARRLQAKLPSFSDAFTQSTPLTRIRDIAHRNDIPKELKAEIKHTIQNKLHRNAGPEDLVATEAMLARITATPGACGGCVEGWGWRLAEVRAEDYCFVLLSRFINSLEESGGPAALAGGSDGAWALPLGALVVGLRHLGMGEFSEAFVEEFRRFAAELRDFFSAGSLTDMLDAIRPSLDDASVQLLDIFAQAKARLDAAGPAADRNALMDALHGTATVRALLAAGLGSGLRNDAPDRAMVMRQRQGDACRGRGVLDTFAERARTLGSALGLDPATSHIFAEAEIRASVIFQLSKLCSLLLRAAGLVAGASPYDVIVGGEAAGVLLAVPALAPGCLVGAGGRPAVLLVDSASGDEEVGALGPGLRGVILRQEVPHLSHLGVRARQEGVLFLACEDAEVVEAEVAPLLGREVRLAAGPAGVSLAAAAAAPAAVAAPCGGGGAGGGAAARPVAAVPEIKKASSISVLPLSEATIATAGAKAAACGHLLRLASMTVARPGSGGDGNGAGAQGGGAPLMRSADGVVLPFGGMEAAIAAAGQQDQLAGLLRDLKSQLASWQAASGAGSAAAAAGGAAGAGGAAAPHLAALDALCGDVQALLRGLRLPQAVLRQVAGAFDPATHVIARSSANVEDLAGLSGAGLYDSVPNVPAGDLEALQASAEMRACRLQGVVEWRLAEVRAEDYCFVLLSRFINSLEESGGPAALAGGSDGAWALPLGALVVGLRHLGMGGYETQECMAVEHELTIWQRMGGFQRHDNALRCLRGRLPRGGRGKAGEREAHEECAAICNVWASLFSRRAVLSRAAAGVPQEAACMAVAVQRQLAPQLCFVLHTRHPVSGDPGVLSAEVAPGMGEVLASGTRGLAWRLKVAKRSGEVKTESFANFSQAWLPAGEAPSLARAAAGCVVREGAAGVPSTNGAGPRPAADGPPDLSLYDDARAAVGTQLAAVGQLLEREFGVAQDVEGCYVDGSLYVVQTRPQP